MSPRWCPESGPVPVVLKIAEDGFPGAPGAPILYLNDAVKKSDIFINLDAWIRQLQNVSRPTKAMLIPAIKSVYINLSRNS